MQRCRIDGCEKPASLLPTGRPRYGGKCSAHAQRQTRQKPLNSPVREYGRPGAKRLVDAAIRLAHAETDDEYKRAYMSLLKAAQRTRRPQEIVEK